MNIQVISNHQPYSQRPEFLNLIAKVKADLVNRDRQGEQAPTTIIEYLKAQKIGALRLPQAHGGQGLSIEELFAVIIELGAADSEVAHIFHAHFQFTEDVLKHPDPSYRELWFKRIGQGLIISNALAEPSNHTVGNSQLLTHISSQDRQLYLEGKKYFTTGTLHADYVLVWAKSHLGQLCHVVVPTSRQGVTIQDDWLGIGQRYTASGTTTFHHVQINEDEIRWINPEARINKPFAQLYIQAIIAGQTKAIETRAAELLQNRKRSFSYGSSEDASQEPLFLEKVGEISALAFLIEQGILKAARSLDRVAAYLNQPEYETQLKAAAIETAKVKVAIDPLALKAANLMFEVIGASAMAKDSQNDRYWRNIRTLSTHNPVSLKAKVLGDILVNRQDVPNIGYF